MEGEIVCSPEVIQPSTFSMQKEITSKARSDKQNQRHNPGEGITQTMSKTKSLQSIIDGPLKNTMPSFGELGVQVHLDFTSDKKGETRNMRTCDTRGRTVGL